MATAPAVARRQTSYASPTAERHQRNTSGTVRSPNTPGEVHQTEYSHASMSNQQSLAGVARRDYETTNLARPHPSRRSSSRDGGAYVAPSPAPRAEATRNAHRSDSRPGHHRYSSEIPRTPASASHAGSQSRSRGDAPSHEGSTTMKRRTTITAQTGVWSLGKTIGAGSMGKVKIAKHMDTGEQVCRSTHCVRRLTPDIMLSFRLLLRSFHVNLPTSTTMPEIESAQITQRKFEPLAKLPL